MEAFLNEVIMAYGDWRFLMLTFLMLVVGLVFCQGYKKRFVIPALILTAAILNPLFYNLWYKFNDRSYWRMLWMIPIVPVCTIIPSFFIEKSKKQIVMAVFLTVSIAVIVLSGSFIYKSSRHMFTAASNPEKVPDDVAEIAEVLLELDEYPTMVADSSISTYIRQYSGRITSPYSRSSSYNPLISVASDFRAFLNEDRMPDLAQIMLNYDYKYLVTQNDDDGRKRAIDGAGFELIRQVNQYGIYAVKGNRSEKRSYNELHQVTRIDFVGEDGELRVNDLDFSSIVILYDPQHRIVCEQTLDNAGKLVNSTRGYARVQYVYSDGAKNPYKYYFDNNDNSLHMGSGFFHEYLQNLLGRNVTIFISVRDDASSNMNSVMMDDLHALGIKSDIRGKYRYSFIAIVKSTEVDEQLGLELVEKSGSINDIPYSIKSAGMLAGNYSSIMIDGIEYSTNSRGLNIVVIDNENNKVIDSIGFDTFLDYVPAYKKEITGFD